MGSHSSKAAKGDVMAQDAAGDASPSKSNGQVGLGRAAGRLPLFPALPPGAPRPPESELGAAASRDGRRARLNPARGALPAPAPLPLPTAQPGERHGAPLFDAEPRRRSAPPSLVALLPDGEQRRARRAWSRRCIARIPGRGRRTRAVVALRACDGEAAAKPPRFPPFCKEPRTSSFPKGRGGALDWGASTSKEPAGGRRFC